MGIDAPPSDFGIQPWLPKAIYVEAIHSRKWSTRMGTCNGIDKSWECNVIKNALYINRTAADVI